ncbi:hypothetical protein [Pseudidiomarina homiensis]|uniref:hypothetical protein n=1 Tax=Pseudidiomarina homiensis TaxID=364198 RepID=UPI00215B201D|nr:hypothetical protein [Pseudidiomarina homiensis]
MRKWLVPLSGNSQVLYNFNNCVRSPDFCIFEDSEDHLGEAYFFESIHVNGETDIRKALGRIKGLLELINGAVAIHWGFNTAFAKHKISFTEALFSDLEYPDIDDYSRNSESINLSEVPPLNPFTKQLTTQEVSKIEGINISLRVRMAESRSEVLTLLRQISHGSDWRNLYSIWDSVAHFCGGEKEATKKLALDEQQKRAFTGTANSFGALGPAARHGEKGWEIPSELMTLVDANDFVHGAVESYLKKFHCMRCFARGLLDA